METNTCKMKIIKHKKVERKRYIPSVAMAKTEKLLLVRATRGEAKEMELALVPKKCEEEERVK